MAQVAHEEAPRISLLLPTVKCSSCGQPVPLPALGDHVCPPLPTVERAPTGRPGPAPAPTRDPFQRPPPDKSSAAAPKTSNLPLPRSSPAPFDPERVSPPARDALPSALKRVRTPSNPGRPAPASPARVAFMLQPTGPVQRVSSPLTPPPPSFPSRASSNATPPSMIHPRPSFERAPTSASVSALRPSLDTARPPANVRGPSPLDSRRSPGEQKPPTPPAPPFIGPPRTPVPAAPPGPVPFPSSAPIVPLHMSTRQPPPPPLSLVYPRVMDREIDTKTGGEAGMAGVGRRGFAAAARAAMFAASHPPHLTTQYLETKATALAHVMRAAITPPLSPNSVQTSSPVSPLPVSPGPLSNTTSTNGQYSQPPSSRNAPPLPTPNDKAHPLSFSPSGVRIASPSRSPSLIPNPFERRLSGETISQSPMPDPHLPLPFLDALKTELDPENESDDESVYTTHTDPKKDDDAPSSPVDSDVGLAYAHDSDDDTPVVMPLDVRKSTAIEGKNQVKFPTCATPDRKGPCRQISAASLRSATSTHSATASSAGSARARSASAATQSTARSVGALERAMEALIEEGASVSVLASGSVLASIGGPASSRGTGKPSRSNTVPGPASPEQKPPKLPTRSHTSPSHPHVHSERVGLTGEVARIRNRGPAKRKVRTCVGCDSKIEDGRWIQMDGGNVLCERCWKNMYLPKCRRCNLPIEKQAVSSRDGQLKGKYHKECFNCHTCQKPFPDKEFYVFDGKPFCAYHYHEANDSLCGAPSCGQPIEGPCAVIHSGKRYHPEHLLCESEGGCEEKLEEYWEVDGQMFCERHATLIGSHDGGWSRGHDPASGTQTGGTSGTDEGRMMKRLTRFIDLGGGGDDELDIR